MREKGQSLVELAVGFVILMFLLSGAVEFSMVFFESIQLHDAVQEGGLYGSICQNEAEVKQRFMGSSNSPINLQEDVEVSIDYPNNGKAIRVKATYQHKIFMPFVPEIVGRDYIELHAEVTDTILTDCQ